MRRINRLNLTSIILGVLITAILLLSESGFVRVLPDVPMLQWSKTYSANEAYSLTQTCDGGFALAGVNATYSPQSRGYVDYLPVLIKTNAEGIVEWEKTFTNETGAANTVFQTSDSGFFITGGNWMLRTDPQGNVQWSQYTESSLEIVWSTQASDGSYVLAGYTSNVASWGLRLCGDIKVQR